MRNTLIFSLILIVSIASLTQSARAARWQGKPIQAVIEHYGQPSLTNHLHNGNTVYVFSIQSSKNFTPPFTTHTTTFAGPKGQTIGVATPSFAEPQYSSILCTLTCEVNARGIVEREQAEGSGCGL